MDVSREEEGITAYDAGDLHAKHVLNYVFDN